MTIYYDTHAEKIIIISKEKKKHKTQGKENI